MIKIQYLPTNGWKTSTPEEQGMDSNVLKRMFEQFKDCQSCVIVRNGYIVAEKNYYPINTDTKLNIFSSTKSVVSALIGIAIKEGYIRDQYKFHNL